MKTITSFIVCVVLFFMMGSSSYAQNWSSVGTIDNYIGIKAGVDANTNHYIAGNFFDSVTVSGVTYYAGGYNDVFVCKYDSAGSLLWIKHLEADNVGMSAMKVTPEGAIYIAGLYSGTLQVDSVSITSVQTRPIIIKINPEGNCAWIRQRITAAVEGTFRNLFITPDEEIYTTTGLTQTGYTINNAEVIKMDSSGNELWSKFYTLNIISGCTGSMNLVFSDIIADEYGHVMVAGINNIPSSCTATCTLQSVPVGSDESFIISFDTAGNFRYINKYNNHFMSLFSLQNGNYAFTAWNMSSMLIAGVPYLSQGSSDFGIAYIDSTGNNYGGTAFGGIGADDIFSVTQDNMHNLLLFGSYGDTVTFNGVTLAPHDPLIYDGDIYLLSLNPANNTVNWNYTFGDFGGDYGVEAFYNKYNNRIFCAGTSFSDSLPLGSVTLMNPNNRMSFFGEVNMPLGAAVNELSADDNSLFKIYPNPSSSSLTYMMKDHRDIERLTIHNELGSVVNTFSNIDPSSGVLDIPTLKSGVYMLEAQTKHAVYTKKFIKL